MFDRTLGAGGLSNFRGVFMRDGLPRQPKQNECGILNLDDTGGGGTHWVAWFKVGSDKFYFDSYGVQPPLELIKYLKSTVGYNTEEVQPRGSVICGHLCLYVLKRLTVDLDSFQDILNVLHW